MRNTVHIYMKLVHFLSYKCVIWHAQCIWLCFTVFSKRVQLNLSTITLTSRSAREQNACSHVTPNTDRPLKRSRVMWTSAPRQEAGNLSQTSVQVKRETCYTYDTSRLWNYVTISVTVIKRLLLNSITILIVRPPYAYTWTYFSLFY